MTGNLKSILAIYDDAVGSDDVLVRAIVLSRASNARLTVAQPLGQYPQSLAAIEEAQRRLSRIVPWIAQEGVDFVSTEVLVGTPHAEITRQALRQNADLVIANANMRQSFKDLLLGKTANRLMRHCPCPVWIVRPRQASRDAIMAVVDANRHAPERCPGARVIDLAVTMAQAHQARLHIVRPWQVDGNEGEMLRSELPDETRRAILEKHEAAHRDELEALLAGHETASIDIERHLPRGRAPSTVAALADHLNVGFVVVGMVPRHGVSAPLNSTTAEAVFDAVRCGVVVVKPDGFRTPISIAETEEPAPLRLRASSF